MALDEAQQRMWQEQMESEFKEFNDPDAELTPMDPIRLPVSYEPTNPVDIFQAVTDAKLRGIISEEQAELVFGYFGDLVRSENAEAMIADLPRESGDDGKTIIVLQHPGSSEVWAP